MSLTYHHPGADEIPRTPSHALIHGEALTWLYRRERSILRESLEAYCDKWHEAWTVHGMAHVCRVNDRTGRIQQIWVREPVAIGT